MRSGRLGIIVVTALVVVAVLGAWLLPRFVRRPVGQPPRPTAVTIEDQVARELAAVHFSEDRFEEARSALAPLLERPKPDPEDLVRGAIVELALKQRERARTLLTAALRSRPDAPAVHYNLGLVSRADGDLKTAAAEFRRAHELAPDDYPTYLILANTLADLEDPGAEAAYRDLLKKGFEYGGSWYLTTLYRLNRLLFQGNKADEARQLLQRFTELQDTGLAVPSSTDLDLGTFGRLDPPRPQAGITIKPGETPNFAPAVVVAKAPGALGILALDLVADWRATTEEAGNGAARVGPPDLLAWGPFGIRTFNRSPRGVWASQRVFDRPVSQVRAFDLEEDGDLDLWVVTEDGVRLLVAGKSGFAAWPGTLPKAPAAPADLEPVDYDHDGDLDLLLVGSFGATLWRNDGAAQGGGFTDAGADTGLPRDRAFDWCLTEDFDTDQDVDFLLGGRGSLFLADNLRGGHFGDRTAALPGGISIPDRPVVADLDGDGRPDLRTTGAPARLLRGSADGAFLPVDPASETPLPPNAGLLADANMDGLADLWWATADGLRGVQALGRAGESVASVAIHQPLTEGTPIAIADLDGDLVPDVAGLGREGIILASGVPAGARAVRLALRGAKDNRRGVGAIVEIRAGSVYRRLYWRGQPELLGLGDKTSADWIRVTWPNGVTQNVLAAPAGTELVIDQKEGLVGSCPFLYVWNGARYEYVTDVLGVTALGMPIAPGQIYPPDHDEYVLVKGEQLSPRDGAFEIQLTEEMREVTYLDRVRLDVIDHPAGSEIYPNERYAPPPYPAVHTHTVVAPIAPLRAPGSDGRDWAKELRAVDMDFAAPFAPYVSRSASSPPWGGKFLGLTPPHTLEVDFDPHAVRGAARLRLVMTGWFYDMDSSVNVALSRTPGIGFAMPALQVPDRRGGWRDAGPPIGTPAGRNNTMVVDVTDILSTGDPRVRISTNLRIYWDSIRLAVDADDAPLRIASLEPQSARLWERGFGQPIELFGSHRLEWFDWDHLAPQPRFNQHPGLYTRLGDVLPLLTGIDDRFVVMGSGDALQVRFDSRALPALPDGWRRDFILFLDGWAKDRDPNSLEAEHVEPLPFHGMSGYPYRADEAYPDGPEDRAWRLEWLTRPARRWIEPLADPAVQRRAP